MRALFGAHSITESRPHFISELVWQHVSFKQAAFHRCYAGTQMHRHRRRRRPAPASVLQIRHIPAGSETSCELPQCDDSSVIAVIGPAGLFSWPKTGRLSSLKIVSRGTAEVWQLEVTDDIGRVVSGLRRDNFCII